MRTEWITSGKWFKYAEYIEIGTNYQDVYAMMNPCRQDNYYLFGLDMGITVDEGDVKCGIDDPQTASGGNWEFQVADTKIKFSANNTSVTYDITHMSDTAMTLVYSDQGANSKLTVRYKHIK